MLSQSLVLGYHGCDRELALRVACGEEELRPSENAYDWLGHGTYFWEDSPTRAMRWTEELKLPKPHVLGAIIDCGNCLNLADAQAISEVKAAHQEYIQTCKEMGFRQARNQGADWRARFLDCAVMEALHQLRAERNLSSIDTVRGFFIEGKEIYPRAGFRELDHIQICVRSQKQIIGYFLRRGFQLASGKG
jgi:hypothetical protein